MGFMDLSTSVASKKHVDFSDARYQLADKLKQSGNKNVRSTFTLYDNKEYNKTAVQDISAAYALSDKHLPIGELLNKMVDLIIDMEDGVLDTEKDAVYAWKYSMALLSMYDDKSKRQGTLSVFDNGLKNSVTNSQLFISRYPGKYTSRTNFYDAKVKDGLVSDIVATFKEVALPQIHDSAIKQSREVAEKHSNPILDKIVQWAVDNYKCEADSFFEVKEDASTRLYFSNNTIILHLKNGYDMSIIGSVGTDHDDKFAISIFDARNIALDKHGERISQDEIQDALQMASENAPVDPLTKLLSLEKDKNEVLKQQYEILSNIRPMIPAEVLEIQAAESVVGADYIWGCKQYRLTHEDLPADFKLEDVELPQFAETNTDATDQQNELTEAMDEIAKSLHMQSYENELSEHESDETDVAEPANEQSVEAPYESTSNESLNMPSPPEALFEIQEPKVEEKKFGDPSRVDFSMPTLSHGVVADPLPSETKNVEKDFDMSATLLPGITPIKKSTQEEDVPSATKQAKPAPSFMGESLEEQSRGQSQNEDNNPRPNENELIDAPELLLDDLDSLFA